MLTFPAHDYSAATGFGTNTLDRLSERREDAAFIASLRADTAARAILFVGELIVVGEGAQVIHPKGLVDALGGQWDEAVLLGVDGTGPLFAATVEPFGEDAPFTLENLRPLAVEGAGGVPVPRDVLGAVAQARGVLGWHMRHQFCSNCGAPTVMAQAGMRRDCPSCGAHHFPRTDPVVIMLAVNGDKCLLGRQTRFVNGVYSCLAGFMEPGETVEAAVRREIWEEAGVQTSRVSYHASQPWPFPSSLMIGCFAQATSTDIDPRDAELEDVRWFDRADIAPMLDQTHPIYAAPPPVAIAHHLLRAYSVHGAPVVLADAPTPVSA
ncbi:MAG: NAD(+) diphosphatase [Pseudomonadota bacterium]